MDARRIPAAERISVHHPCTEHVKQGGPASPPSPLLLRGHGTRTVSDSMIVASVLPGLRALIAVAVVPVCVKKNQIQCETNRRMVREYHTDISARYRKKATEYAPCDILYRYDLARCYSRSGHSVARVSQDDSMCVCCGACMAHTIMHEQHPQSVGRRHDVGHDVRLTWHGTLSDRCRQMHRIDRGGWRVQCQQQTAR